MIPWIQAQADATRDRTVEVIITPPERPQVGLLMDRKDALAAAAALLQAVANESGVELKISAKPIPEILRCPNQIRS